MWCLQVAWRENKFHAECWSLLVGDLYWVQISWQLVVSRVRRFEALTCIGCLEDGVVLQGWLGVAQVRRLVPERQPPWIWIVVGLQHPTMQPIHRSDAGQGQASLPLCYIQI